MSQDTSLTLLTGAASSSVLPQPPVAAFPNGGNELPQSCFGILSEKYSEPAG